MTEVIERPHPTVLAKLRALVSGDRFAENYSTISALLAELSADEFVIASRMLATMNLAEVSAGPSVSVSITGHSTLATLATATVGELVRHGYVPRIRQSDFDSYLTDLLDSASEIYREPTDFTVCVLDHSIIFDEVPTPFTVDDVLDTLGRKMTQIHAAAAEFSSHGRGHLYLNTMVLPREWAQRILDAPGRARLSAAWRRAMADLLDIGARGEHVTVLDTELSLGDGAVLTEPRFATYVHAQLSDQLQRSYANTLGYLIRARTGRSSKVLAVDLDGTLWGGVVGDDGVEGIEIGQTPRGQAFTDFQHLLLQLQSQGVLLAAVSKNDADIVAAALENHPEQVVRSDNFVAVVANWRPKSENIADLAKRLNIGVDSFVFVDDSVHEIAAVSAALPQVPTVHVAGDPALHVQALLGGDWFATNQITTEDRVRTRLYHEETARSEYLAVATSMTDFLADLEVSARIHRASDSQLARLSQLTLRTNQFNLTTLRLDQGQVSEYAHGVSTAALVIEAADRFGDNGVVGAILVRTIGEVLHIDNMVLSCRVFGRGIETACLSALLAAARSAGYRSVAARFSPTAKNAKVAQFLPEHGFVPESESEDDSAFRHSLATIVAPPNHLRLSAPGQLVPVLTKAPR